MTDFQYADELKTFMNTSAVSGKWQTFDNAQQNALIERACFDVNAYASIIAVDFTLDNDFCRRALFEQTAHIVSQYDAENGEKTILQETISGFGSRKYKEPDSEWLSVRAKSYIEQLKRNIRILH